MANLRERLKIARERLDEINSFLLDPNNELVNRLISIVEKLGGPEEINRKARETRKLENLLARLKEQGSPYLADLEWLTEQRDRGAFIKLADYRKKVLGDRALSMTFDQKNAGTIFVACLLHKMGIDNEFKISVFMGNDNPFAVFWTLMMAKLLSRPDGSTSLIGFNYSNSVNNDTILASNEIRAALGLTDNVRFEHHITETYKSIVRQPYNPRDELVEVAGQVQNISAKHEGDDPDIEEGRVHPSDILDYFLPKKDIEAQGLMKALEENYLDKHDALNKTAETLTRAGIGVICAGNLH